MKKSSKQKVTALFVALIMIFTAIPINNVDAVDNVSSYADYIGNKATFNIDNCDYFIFSDNPAEMYWDSEHKLTKEEIPANLELVITDCYVSSGDSNPIALWYKVEVASGYTLPEKLVQYPWVYQNYLGEYADPYDSLIIYDNNDEQITLQKGNITVSGSIPQGVGLHISSVEDNKINAVNNSIISFGNFSEVLSVCGYDLSLKDENTSEEWQPGVDNLVTINLSEIWTWKGSKGKPDIEVYHILDDQDAVSKAKESGCLMTSTDSVLMSLYEEEANLVADKSVPYICLSSSNGDVTLHDDGSISFVTDSFSDYYIVLGFTDGMSLTNGGNDTYYVEPGTTLTFNRSATWSAQGEVPDGIVASGRTITVGNNVTIPAEVTFEASWNSNKATITVKVATRNQNVSGLLNSTTYPIILSVVQGVTSIPSEPGHTSGRYYQFNSSYSASQSYPPNSFAPTASGIISPAISDILIKSIDGSNTIGYADASGTTILQYLSGINWEKMIDVAVSRNWKAIDGETITDENKGLYTIIPYVIKLMDGSNYSGKGWHIDCAIVLKDNVTLSYDMNLDNYQVTGAIKLPNTSSGIPNDTFNTTVGYITITKGSNNSELQVNGTLSATYGSEQMNLTFKGWNTSPDGSGVWYMPGSSISINKDTVLYAIWEGAYVPGELYIYKEVTVENGGSEPNNATYEFSIGFSIEGTYNYTIYKANGTTENESISTSGTIRLADGEYAVFTDVPANASYSVTEEEGEYETTSDGSVGSIRSGGRAVARFINHYAYIEPEVTIKYEAGIGGSVSISEETLKQSTGIAQGSIATALDGYRLVGWYSDKECTNVVSTAAYFVPQKNGELWMATTYYAKFEKDLTCMTISKSGTDTKDKNQTFLFHVVGENVDLIVTIHGNSSVTVAGLKVGGSYTITEITDWSWRYQFSSVTTELTHTTVTGGLQVELSKDSDGNIITFHNVRGESKWLNGDSYCVNEFNGNYVIQ